MFAKKTSIAIVEGKDPVLTEGDKAVVQDDLIKILHAVDHVQISILRTVCLSIFP